MILKSSKELYSQFFRDIFYELPYEVFITTFGLWCGINRNGDLKSICTSFRLLDYLNDSSDVCKTTVVVGYGNVISPVVIETARQFKNIKFVGVNEFHSKCILTSNGIFSVGSSNLNDSEWFELNLYNRIDVGTEEFLDIHKTLKWYEWVGEVIDPESYPTVDTDDLIRSLV